MTSFSERPVRIVVLSGPIQRRDAISDVVLALLREVRRFFSHPATEIRVLCPFSEANDKSILVLSETPFSDIQDVLKKADAAIVTFGYQNDCFNLIDLAKQAVRCLVFFGVTPPNFLPKRIHSELVGSLRQVSLLARFHIVSLTSDYLFQQLEGAGMDLGASTMTKISLPLRREFFESPDVSTVPTSKIVYCGRFVESKGVKELVRAFAESRFAEARYRLLLIGSMSYSDPGYVDDLSKLIDELDLRDLVDFAFDVSTADLVRHYDTALLFATGSMHEGFGYPLAEAIARQVPILCGAFTAMPETSRGLGVYFDAVAVEPIRRGLDQSFDLLTSGKYLIDGSAVPLAEWRRKAYTQRDQFLPEHCFASMFEALADVFKQRFQTSGYNGYLSTFPWTYPAPCNESAIYFRLQEDLIESNLETIRLGVEKNEIALPELKSGILRSIPKNGKKYTTDLCERVAYDVDMAEARCCFNELLPIFKNPKDFISEIILVVGARLPIKSISMLNASQEGDFLAVIDQALEPLGNDRRDVEPLRRFAFAALSLKHHLEFGQAATQNVQDEFDTFMKSGCQISKLQLSF